MTAPSGKNVGINQANEVDPTHYFDPSSGAVFQVDHMTGATSESQSPGLKNKSEQDEAQEEDEEGGGGGGGGRQSGTRHRSRCEPLCRVGWRDTCPQSTVSLGSIRCLLGACS